MRRKWFYRRFFMFMHFPKHVVNHLAGDLSWTLIEIPATTNRTFAPRIIGIALLIASHDGDCSSIHDERFYCGLISIGCGIGPAGGRIRV